MGRISENYKYNTSPMCKEDAIVKGEKYRFTILTPSLIRMEYSDNGVFEDRATQVVINRNFDVPKFTVFKKGDMLVIRTERLELYYHTQHPFSESSLTARYYGEWGDHTATWRFKNTAPTYGDAARTLPGTVSSLDSRSGPVPLGASVMSTGYAELDDSKSLIIADDGWIDERPNDTTDVYLFAYRENYLLCLHDFLQLTGKAPLLPRYALGNWWSRYYAYSDVEYKELINTFKEKKIPLSVAVLDMDWHITDVEKRYGTGWSGYTFNKDLFPKPEEFLKWMHDNGLKVTANIHDREGFAPCEENYEIMAKELGVDYENRDKIEFDFCSPKYIETYFKYTHHNNEEKGIDFWWVDGYPENRGPILKADIPWMLNHYHYIDSMRNGKRGMLLSRNCGLGGHRYGIGFSADTNATWEMLNFLPYFTSTSANVGFGCWSHDVGGFMCGEYDEEMMVRWEQFCVFSSINRLHSSENPFMSREPWKYDLVSEKVLTRFLRLRHELIPYIYTLNYKCYSDNVTLITPLYYHCTNNFGFKNEYFFGDSMIVAPITTKVDTITNMGHVSVYLPQGDWFDYFTSHKYIGNRSYNVYRDIYTIPVFVKAGSIIPHAVLDEENGIDNPKHLRIDVFPCASGNFDLYEDDGETLKYQDGESVITKMHWNWSEKPSFEVEAPVGQLDLIPKSRNYTLRFRKINNVSKISVVSEGKKIDFDINYIDGAVEILLKDITKGFKVIFEENVTTVENDINNGLNDFLRKARISHTNKWKISNIYKETGSAATVIAELSNDKYDNNFKNAITEILIADLK